MYSYWKRSSLGLFSAFGFVCALGWLVGCGDGQGPAENKYPRDEELRMNQLQLKGTHNSYHVAANPPAVRELAYSFEPLDVQLERQGVRKFELDTNFNVQSNQLEVYHIVIVDEGTSCRLFVDCLKVIEGWSRRNPGHHPIFIQIEPKGQLPEWLGEGFFELFEREILSAFPRERIITPDDVQGASPSLREAVREGGWPTLREARGKVVFFVDNATKFREAYTRGGQSLAGRLMFVNSEPEAEYAAFRILNNPVGEAASQAIRDAVLSGMIVRTRADSEVDPALASDTTQFEAALTSGAQIISTDFPAPSGLTDHFIEIPGGTPSRCHPFIAPADCTSLDIERPDGLR